MFKAQPQIISRLQTYFEERTWALYEFKFENRSEGTFRSMGAKSDKYGIATILPPIGFTDN